MHLPRAPRIAASEENHLYLGTGDRVYVRGDGAGAAGFQIFRPGRPWSTRDRAASSPTKPAMSAPSAWSPRPARRGRPHLRRSSSSVQRNGCRRPAAADAAPVVLNYVPHAPQQPFRARVMSIYAGVTYAGQSQVVTVNRGTLDGLDVGSVLQLYHFRTTVCRPARRGFLGLKRATIRLPDEQYGSLFIFRVFGHVAYRLVMQVTAPVEVGDVAKSPE